MRDKITKEEYFNLDNGIVQDITREFIRPHIFRNQSYLIAHLQENFVEGFKSEIKGGGLESAKKQAENFHQKHYGSSSKL